METAIQIVVGLVLLTTGGEATVRGAVGVARRLGLSELLIGLTLVGIGTSTPELVTSVQAALAGSPGLAVGNVVGSNISNVLLIFALTAVLKPVEVDAKAIRRDGAVLMLATAACVLLGVGTAVIERWMGALLVAGLAGYIFLAWRMERLGGPAAELHKAEGHSRDPAPGSIWLSVLMSVAGIALLVVGAGHLVKGAITLARLAGLSETVIGLTIVAVGTSLPELVASLAAALKGRSEVAFGNIIGSNIANILGILGLTALITPVAVPDDLLARDWIAFVGAALLLVLHAAAGARATRIEGVSLIIVFAFYTLLLVGGPAAAG